MKILFAISTMQNGGAERTVASLANFFIDKNNEITIMTLDNDESFYDLDKKIDHIKLNLYKENRSLFNKILDYKDSIYKVRRIFKYKSPDIILSMNYKLNPIIIMANIFINIPIIYSHLRNI